MSDRELAPGQIVELLASKHKGFYLVQHVKDEGEKLTLDVLPETAWDITDPVARKHKSRALEFNKTYRHLVKIVPAHAPICRECGMMWPCSHHKETAQVNQMMNEVEWEERKRERARETRRLARLRYETPGICPACQQPVTYGQPSQTFTTNAVIAGGPPVTYHVSRHCCVDVKHHSMTD